MSVRIVDCPRFDSSELAPIVQGIQFFTTIKDGEVMLVFPVDHNKYPTATSFLAENPSHRANEIGWDCVRSTTLDELAGFMEDHA